MTRILLVFAIVGACHQTPNPPSNDPIDVVCPPGDCPPAMARDAGRG